MNELIRLDALNAMRDMNVHARSPATWSASYWDKIYFDLLFSENASKMKKKTISNAYYIPPAG